MSPLSMLLIPMASSGSTFGGGELRFVGEVDPIGSEALIELDVDPVMTVEGDTSLVWFPLGIGWGIVPTTNRLDRVTVGVAKGVRRLGSGRASALFSLGHFTYDQDLGYADLGLAEGAVGVTATELVSLRIGVDLHARALAATAGALRDPTATLMLGVPLAVRLQRDEIAGLFYASTDAALRPSVGVVGPKTFSFDARWAGELGIHIVRESDADVRAFLSYVGRADTFTALTLGNEHALGLGLRAAL